MADEPRPETARAEQGSAELNDGTFFVFTGLKGRADLNDKLGIVVAQPNEQTERFGVLVHGTAEKLAIKATNLVPATVQALKRLVLGDAAVDAMAAARDPEAPLLEEAVLVKGKAVAGDVGYYPMRMMAALHGGLADVVYVAGARLPGEMLDGMLQTSIAQQMERLTCLREKLLAPGAMLESQDRKDAAQLIYDAFAPLVLMMHALGTATRGKGVLVVEAADTLEAVVCGMVDGVSACESGTFSPWVPLMVTFLTNKQSKLWHFETMRHAKGDAYAKQRAQEQMQRVQLNLQTKPGAVFFSMVCHGFEGPVTVGRLDDANPDGLSRGAFDEMMGAVRSLGLTGIQALRISSASEMRLLNVHALHPPQEEPKAQEPMAPPRPNSPTGAPRLGEGGGGGDPSHAFTNAYFRAKKEKEKTFLDANNTPTAAAPEAAPATVTIS